MWHLVFYGTVMLSFHLICGTNVTNILDTSSTKSRNSTSDASSINTTKNNNQTSARLEADLSTFGIYSILWPSVSTFPPMFQCGVGYGCIDPKLCLNGMITTSGVIDYKIQLNDQSGRPCGKPGDVCCRLPDNIPSSNQCSLGEICVPFAQCDGGRLNTDGGGLIDERIMTRLVNMCSDSRNPYSPAMCCKTSRYWPTAIPSTTITPEIPTPYTLPDCPGNLVCIPEYLCSDNNIGFSGASAPYYGGGPGSRCALSGKIGAFRGVCCSVLDFPTVLPVPPTFPYPVPPTDPYPVPPPFPYPVPPTDPYPVPPTFPYPVTLKCGTSSSENEMNKWNSPDQMNTAKYGEFPWQVLLTDRKTAFRCGATLIADRWVLTAAHCVAGMDPSSFQVRLGEWKVNSDEEPFRPMDISVDTIIVYPYFQPANAWNDIALVRLSRPVSPWYHINYVCLPRKGQSFVGRHCISTGWGKDSFEGKYQNTMKKTNLTIINKNKCQELLRQTRLGPYFILDNSFLCAGGEENKDSCRGDGGGPLVCKDPDSGQYALSGITSWGIGCGQRDVPGVYVDVQAFTTWVQAIVRSTNSYIGYVH